MLSVAIYVTGKTLTGVQGSDSGRLQITTGCRPVHDGYTAERIAGSWIVTKSETATDRRKFKRIAVSVAVRYAPRQFGDDVPPDLLEGRAVNLSRMGAGVEISHKLRIGGRVELTFMQTDPPGCVSVLGEVVRASRVPGGVGVGRDGQPAPLHIVGLKFTRMLELRELAMLRGNRVLDATEISEREEETGQPTQTSEAG